MFVTVLGAILVTLHSVGHGLNLCMGLCVCVLGMGMGDVIDTSSYKVMLQCAHKTRHPSCSRTVGHATC